MVDFDQDKPAAATSLRASNPQILDNQEALQDAINREHIFSGTSSNTQTGDHTQGSARCFFTDTAPATRIDGANFIETDNGSLWIDTDDNAFYIMTDYSEAVAADKWTPISEELYETFLANPRVFLDTLGVTGKLTALADAEVTTTLDVGTSLDIAGTIAVVGTIDDDSMSTATDTNIATSESIKVYADAAPAAQMEPSTYAGGETTTLANGLIVKFGFKSGNGAKTITFGTAFPTAAISLTFTEKITVAAGGGTINSGVTSLSASSAVVWINTQNTTGAYWIAMGY